MLGNLCGDFVKGSKLGGLNPSVAEGVRLHRSIDLFTDSHELIKEAKGIVRPKFKLFSGVVIDMFFDHFVAKNHSSLNSHAKYVYNTGRVYSSELPASFNNVLFYMEKYNWLEAYAKVEGLSKIMLQMRKRIGDKSPLEESVDILVQKEIEFDVLFKQIWDDAQQKFSF